MGETFHYSNPDAAGWFLRGLRDADVYYEDSFILENLFTGDRIAECDEAILLKDEQGSILALAIISKVSPAVWSYYTVPDHRRKGYGYRLLVRCLERILESISDPRTKIVIEPINDNSRKHIERLPADMRSRLHVIRR